MKQNMRKWLTQQLTSPVKKAMPLLSAPSCQLIGMELDDMIASAEYQAEALAKLAQRTDSSALVCMMDLSVEAEAFGSTIRKNAGEVPTVVGSIVSDEDDADALEVPEVGAGRTGIYVETVKKLSTMVTDRPILAGAIGPFSLAARLADVTEIMYLCYDEPDAVHKAMEKCTDFLIRYCQAFKDAGADGIALAEPVTGLLSPSLAEEFSEPYVKKLFDAVKSDDFAVIYHNCGNGTIDMIDSILAVGADAYHFGNAIDMEKMLEVVPDDVIVMGNIDPAGEFKGGTPESIRKATLDLMEKCTKHGNFVISSGCDIPAKAPWENIDAFFGAVSEFYGK
ncbi:MAG: uroporphyrinogen decarboxylase family protein [Clostridia bacterium]|nr:uroporphyrinogen decarboxylase family protein [Clostridia bacterium]